MIHLYIMHSEEFTIKLYTDDVMRSVDANLMLHKYGITFIRQDS